MYPSDVDNIEILGVDVDIQETRIIEIADPDIPPTDIEPIKTAPAHQVAFSVAPMPSIQQVEPELRNFQ